ncbi:MAG: cobalt ECF transporter T component CbiQ [Spirulinaceae cyanobacterium]
MHHKIDALAYTNRLRSLPPAQKVGFAIALFSLGYVAPMSIQGAIALWMAIWTVGYARIPAKTYGQLLTLPLSFLLMSLPALVLAVMGQTSSPNGDMLWSIPLGPISLYVSRQGWEQASQVLVRAIALTSCLYFLLLTVPFSDVVRLLRRWGCPALLTELMLLMYRFIFVLTETATELLTAQQSRLGYRNWRLGMRSLSTLVGQLLGRTLTNYQQIRLGLISRGFTGEFRMLQTQKYRTQWRYVTEAIAGYSGLVILTGWHYVHGF